MKITVFTSNQRRHVNLVNLISELAEETYAVLESKTLFPGLVPDLFNSSPIMQKYMTHVGNAEAHLFGKSRFISPRAHTLVMKNADLNHLTRNHLKEALESDIYVVFGSSFIKGWLADFLIEKKALNIHMGLSPYYRGSSCNFWAMYDSRPNYIGATIHYLSKGLDSGPIIFHSVPEFDKEDPFAFTMKAVKKAQQDLVYWLENQNQFYTNPVDQNRRHEIRYSRRSDFTEDVAQEFLERKLTWQELELLINNSKKPRLIGLR